MRFEFGEALARAHILPHAAVELAAHEPQGCGGVQQRGEGAFCPDATPATMVGDMTAMPA